MHHKLKKFVISFFCIIFINSHANAITFNFKDAELRDVIEGFALMVG